MKCPDDWYLTPVGDTASLSQMPGSPGEQRQLVLTSEIQEKDEASRIRFRTEPSWKQGGGVGRGGIHSRD